MKLLKRSHILSISNIQDCNINSNSPTAPFLIYVIVVKGHATYTFKENQDTSQIIVIKPTQLYSLQI